MFAFAVSKKIMGSGFMPLLFYSNTVHNTLKYNIKQNQTKHKLKIKINKTKNKTYSKLKRIDNRVRYTV